MFTFARFAARAVTVRPAALLRPLSTEAATTTTATTTTATPTVSRTSNKVIPSPRGQFNSPEMFLKTIGRGCEKYVDKFKDWDHLFRADGNAMKKDLGIGPKQRKWIMMWANKFKLGIDPYFIPTSKKHTMKRSERLARAKRRRLKKVNKK